MRFDIPKVIKPLNMNAYDMSMDGFELQVWVNPPRGIQNQFYEIRGNLQRTAKQFDEMLEELRDAAEEEKEILASQLDMLNEKVRAVNDQIFGWYADILSRHSDESTHVTIEELREVANEDPALWKFIAEGAQALIREHQMGVSKN